MMRIAVLSGDQPRHLALSELLSSRGLLVGAVVEKRPKYSLDLDSIASRYMSVARRHFLLRDEAEEFFFGKASEDHEVLRAEPGNVEVRNSQEFLHRLNPDLVLIWGTSLISQQFMNEIGVPFWNIHGGLSPHYKGAATLFWPSFFLEPQMSGLTLHIPVSRIDAGPIIHQVGARLVHGDGVQRHAARAVHDSLIEIADFLETISPNDIPEGVPQRKTGKLFLDSDWRPEHLIQVYETYNDQIVDLVIAGELEGRLPHLVSTLWEPR